MKVKQEFNVEFKEITYLCGCGTLNKEIAIVFNGYGFADGHCKSCGKRYKLEVDENFIYAKSIQ